MRAKRGIGFELRATQKLRANVGNTLCHFFPRRHATTDEAVERREAHRASVPADAETKILSGPRRCQYHGAGGRGWESIMWIARARAPRTASVVGSVCWWRGRECGTFCRSRSKRDR